MPSLKLSNLFRRGADRQSLRDRAASLRASVGTPRHSSIPSPAPGSEEAKAAWRAACHEHSIRTAPLHDCPELMRSDRDVWSTQSLVGAMEAGEITVAEYARLHPLASERELRFAQIAHELNIGSLFALAYADEYPVEREADPVLAAIAASHAAEAAMEEFGSRIEPMTPYLRAEENALTDHQNDTRAAVWATVPTSDEGRAALARYVVFQMELTFGADWVSKMDAEFRGDGLLALLAAFAPTSIRTASEGERV